MGFWQNVLRILDLSMTCPKSYGWFHILWIVISVGAGITLCAFNKKITDNQVKNIVMGISITVILFEIYKQINYSFSYTDGIKFDYQWYSFPWQFCSTPMYIGLLMGIIRKGIVHKALSAYLATYALFAGLCVMIYPNDVFIETIGINIQTMVCHGSMITIAMFLLYRGYVKVEHKTILYAFPVFVAVIAIAIIMNEIAYRSGLTETFNMFYISPYQAPSLAVYSIVQQHVPYPWCLIIYFVGFSIAAYLMLLIAMGIRKLGSLKKS